MRGEFGVHQEVLITRGIRLSEDDLEGARASIVGALAQRGAHHTVEMESVHHVYDTRFLLFYFHDQQIPKQRDE
jgi:hypothetical protein